MIETSSEATTAAINNSERISLDQARTERISLDQARTDMF